MVLEWLDLDTVLIGIGFLVIAAISSIIYARWNYGTLEKMGIPVVKPHFFLGSAQDTFSRCIAHIDLENFKRLGPIFGVRFYAFFKNIKGIFMMYLCFRHT